MNILLICNKSPWPPREGGPIAMNAIIEGLIDAGHKVKVLAINSYKYNIDKASIPETYKNSTNIELVYIDLKIRALPALANLFSKSSYHVNRFISKSFADVLENILKTESFDVIQLESLFITPYLPLIRKYTKALVVLRAHNIEHLIWQRLHNGEMNLLKKWYLKHLAKTLKNYELKAINEVDGIVAITDKDAEFFKNYLSPDHVISIPFGLQPELLARYVNANTDNITNDVIAETTNKTLFHLGSMNWLPNQEGIRWFIEQVWPQVHSQHNELTFHIAGREMPGWIRETRTEGVVVDGEVPDALNYMRRYQIMVVPLFSGSGIRIKIIEGMLAGCAIITTKIGAEGINCENGKHLLLAESKQEFISAINKLITDSDYADQMGNEAAQFVMTHHNNEKLIKQLETFYIQHINKK